MDGLHYAAGQADSYSYLGYSSGFFMGADDWERLTWPTTLDEYLKERLKNTVWT